MGRNKNTPGKRPTWNLKFDIWKTFFLYNLVVFRFTERSEMR